MPILFPPEIIENTVEVYHARISGKSRIVYGLLLLLLVIMVVCLPIVKIDVTTESRGEIRSPFENTTIQSALYGEVTTYRMQENKTVQKGDTLIILNSEKLNEQIRLATEKMSENKLFISDLAYLLSGNFGQLTTPKYKVACMHYRSKMKEQEVDVVYLKKELQTQKKLLEQKVIPAYDYQQAKNNYEKAVEQQQATRQEFLSGWASEQTTLALQNIELLSSIKQTEKDKLQYVILAPSTGVLVQVAGFQRGNFIAPGQTLAYISNKDTLLAECYVSPTDIGYIKAHQDVSFQLDAFNYNDWGMLHGSVTQILHDVVLINNKPMFRVRCALYKKTLQLKNGYTGEVQKGLTFTAHFKLTRRSLWQLLFDKVDNWLNPKLIKNESES